MVWKAEQLHDADIAAYDAFHPNAPTAPDGTHAKLRVGFVRRNDRLPARASVGGRATTQASGE